MSKSKQYALAVTVARSRDEVPRMIAKNRASARGETVPMPRKPLWKPGTATAVSAPGCAGREALIIDVAKLDPRVKFIVVYVDQVETST